MLTLAFDTCTDVCTVAIGDEEAVRIGIDLLAPRSHLEKLLPLVQQAMHETSISQSDLEAIAVGIGPGSLTGVRIGVTTARALSQSLKIPCVGLSTLDVVAAAFCGAGAFVCVVMDARRREVYPALYDCSAALPKRLTDYRSISAEALTGELEAYDRVTLAGDGLIPYGERLVEGLGDRASLAPRETWHPRAANMLSLAGRALAAGAGDYREVRPIYTRLSDAEEARASG